MEEATLWRRIASAAVGRLGTVTPDGRPHLVPCCFTSSPDHQIIYSAVDAKPKSTRRLQRLINVVANPAAALLVDHYSDDWSQLWWVRFDGTGRVVERPDEAADAIELLKAKYAQYRREPPAGPVLAIDITSWQSWP